MRFCRFFDAIEAEVRDPRKSLFARKSVGLRRCRERLRSTRKRVPAFAPGGYPVPLQGTILRKSGPTLSMTLPSKSGGPPKTFRRPIIGRLAG
jgi:hypothetical protein